MYSFFFFFFQAEDGIRDRTVTGVQTCALPIFVTVAAKQRWRAGTPVPIVVRLPSGGGFSGGPFHSQNPESSFAHVPGLKCVCPATPKDAKGLLISAIEDPNPVLHFEHKPLYRRAQ